MRRIVLVLVALGALAVPGAASADPSPRACLGQTLKTEVGPGFGAGTASEAQTRHPFGTEEVRGLAKC
jgi:hypothetical protein